MANLNVLDGAAASKYIKSSGAGSSGDPHIIEHLETNSAAIAASLSVMDDWDETNRCAVNLIASQVGVAGGAGAVGATVIRTTLASDDPAVTSLSVLDDWDETNRCAVNLIASQVGITAGAGAVATNTPRVTLASDDPAVSSLSTLAGTVSSSRTAVNLISGQAGITAGAGAVGASTPRVTLASDDPAVVSLAILDDWDETDRCKVNIIAGQAGVTAGAGAVAANTQRVTLASDDPGVVSLALLDDTVATTASAITTKGIAISGTDGTNARVIKTDTSGELQVDVLTMPTVTVTATDLSTIAGAISSSRMAVNLISGQAGITAGAGAVGASTPRVTLASDDPAVSSLSTLSGTVSSSRVAVNPISGQTGIAGGVGSVGATTTRTVLAGCTTGTVTSVNDQATSTTLLAANTSRVGATVYNDSTVDLYLKLGATASTSSFTAKIAPGGMYEVPFGYNGIIDGIWASDASGAARITELT